MYTTSPRYVRNCLLLAQLACAIVAGCSPSASPHASGPASPVGEQVLVVVNRTEVAVVFGYGPPVAPCATKELTQTILTTPNDVPVPPGAWPAPVQIMAPPGVDVLTAIVTSKGVDVREGRLDLTDLPPCEGRPPGAFTRGPEIDSFGVAYGDLGIAWVQFDGDFTEVWFAAGGAPERLYRLSRPPIDGLRDSAGRLLAFDGQPGGGAIVDVTDGRVSPVIVAGDGILGEKFDVTQDGERLVYESYRGPGTGMRFVLRTADGRELAVEPPG